MLYLGTSPGEPAVTDMLNHRRIGLMCQPGSNPPQAGWIWAADNGCFNAKWDYAKWSAWLKRDMPRSGCLFAVVPDVVADSVATRVRFNNHVDEVRAARYPVAYVGQDGATIDRIPWERLDCLFIGGSTEWKMSPAAFLLAAEGRSRGKWVHVGRVNSWDRFERWALAGDSADGTFIAFGPTVNAPKVASWMDRHWSTPRLELA